MLEATSETQTFTSSTWH